MPANGRHDASIQLVEMNEEIMERKGGLLAGTMAAGLDQRAINPGDDLPGAGEAVAERQRFAAESVLPAG